jgi:hypothetical protein
MYESYLEVFEFVEEPRVTDCLIRLTQPPYDGVVVTLGKQFRFTMLQETKAGVEFHYDVIGVPEEFDETLINEDLQLLLGNILVAILELRYSKTDVNLPEGETGFFSLQVKQ